MNTTTKRKLLTVLIGTLSFLVTGLVAGIAIGVPVLNAVVLASWLGFGVSLFEVLFIQAPAGKRFRRLSPILHSLYYSGLVLLLYVTGVAFIIVFVSPPELAQAILSRVPVTLPVVFLISLTIILILRVVSFIGAKNLLYLLTGRYQRPTEENHAFLFIDLKNSTTISEALGAVRAREFISEFIFDISKAITDNRGDVYKFMGDGIIAVWRHDDPSKITDTLYAVTEAHDVLVMRAGEYETKFGFAAEFRAGLHAGSVIASEQGDLRRSIEFNGDHINIAARLEQKAKDHDLPLVFSDSVANELSATPFEPVFIEEEMVKGYSQPVKLYKLKQLSGW